MFDEQFPVDDRRLIRSWEDLGAGAPTLIALASLCSQALASGRVSDAPLSEEAKAILYAARRRGVIEIKGNYRAFEAPARFLTVFVELEVDVSLAFKSTSDPVLTIHFLEGFRELCSEGFVLHHLYRDFSLTRRGFERAGKIRREEVPLLTGLVEEHGMAEFLVD